jgi:hypothetical protein
MGGAALFTVILIAVLVLGTYLLQLVLWLAYAAMVVAYYVGSGIFCAVWAVLDWRSFQAQMRRAQAD